MKKRIVGLLLMMIFFILIVNVDCSADTQSNIKCGIYSKQSNMQDNDMFGLNSHYNESGYYFNDETLYFELYCINGSTGIKEIVSAELYIDNTLIESFSKDKGPFDCISVPYEFDKTGVHQIEWRGHTSDKDAQFTLQTSITTIGIRYIKSSNKAECVISGKPLTVSADYYNDYTLGRYRELPDGVRYQWYYSDNENSKKTIIDGANESSFTIKDTDSFSSRYYYCEISTGNVSGYGEGVHVVSIPLNAECEVSKYNASGFEYITWLKEKYISVGKEKLEGNILRQVPAVSITLREAEKLDVLIDVYISKNKKNWKKISTSVRANTQGTVTVEDYKTKIKQIKDLYKKGSTVYYKIIISQDKKASAWNSNKKYYSVEKIISYKIKKDLLKPDMYSYKKGNYVYLMYDIEGDNCITQYRYGKKGKWKKIPKATGKSKPIRKLKLAKANLKDFYVKCRGWEMMGGKKVFSKWSRTVKISSKYNEGWSQYIRV